MPPNLPPDEHLPGVRSRFVLDPDVVFLNHGSFGACPAAILERQTELRLNIEREPARFFNHDALPLLDEARDALAAFVGADAEDLAFVTNATQAVNTVLRSLPFRAGDELLTTNHEYTACRNALDFVAARTGARVVVADVPFPIDGPDAVVGALLERVTSRTRLALVDHVTSQTALVLPIIDIVRELRQRGVESLVDGAHAVGMVPLDLRALGAAYYTSNCHKWLCAPKGCAFLHVRADAQEDLVPLSVSHGWSQRGHGRSRFRSLFDWTGTDDPTPHLIVPDLLRFLGSIVPGGIPALCRRNHDLAVWARAYISDALGLSVAAPESMIGSMATIPLPPSREATTRSILLPDALQVALMSRFTIEVPVFPWPSPGARCLRVSAQAYNRAADYIALAEALTILQDEVPSLRGER